MHCRKCHYSLANLTENRCPECATEFDPDNPSSYLTSRQIAVDRAQRVGGLIGLGLSLLAILFLSLLTRNPIVLGSMVPGLVTVAILTFWRRRTKPEGMV